MSNVNSDKNKKTLASFLKLADKFNSVSAARKFVDALGNNNEMLKLMNKARKSGTPEREAHGLKSGKHGAIAKAVATSEKDILVALRQKLITLFGEQNIQQRGLDVQQPQAGQFEMNPAEQIQTINENPANDGERPDQLPQPPPEGEEKQPDYATQVPQAMETGFQNLGIPEQSIRQQRQRQIEQTLPGASPDVIQNMVNNTDDGILAGQREDIANEIYEEEKSEIGPGVRGRNVPQTSAVSTISSSTPQPSVRQADIDILLNELNTRQDVDVEEVFAEEEKAETPSQSEAIKKAKEEVRQFEAENPTLAGGVATAASAMWNRIRNASPAVIAVAPWLAFNLVSYQQRGRMNPKAGLDYGAVLSLIGLMSQAGFTAPQGLTSAVQQIQERMQRGDVADMPDDDKAKARTEEEARDTADRPESMQPPQNAPGIQQDPDVMADFRQRFQIPVQDMAADQRANIAGRIQAALGGGAAAGVVNQIIDYARGRLRLDPSSEAAVDIMNRLQKMIKDETEDKQKKRKKEKTGRSRDIQEEPIELDYDQADDPAVGDLRPSFKILGTDEDTETSEQAITEQFKFANYMHVEEGHGNGPNNPLYLQNKTWDNMVRFVNNFMPAVDRITELEECSIRLPPQKTPLKSVAYAKKVNRKLKNGDPDLLFKNAYIQPAIMRPDNLYTMNLENPNIPFNNVNEPTTDFAEFKQTSNLFYPTAGTNRPSMPRTTYSNPKSAAGLKFNTDRYSTQSSLELRPAPKTVIPRDLEPIPWTTVNSVEKSYPQDPFTSEFGGSINNPYGSMPPSFGRMRKKY